MNVLEVDHTTYHADDTCETLAFTAKAHSCDQYLVLSRSFRVTSQDKELGLIGLHIESNDQSVSGYDLIKRMVWTSGRSLTIALNDRGKSIFGNEELELSISDDQAMRAMERMCVTENVTFEFYR